jgi:hypothetical protein
MVSSSGVGLNLAGGVKGVERAGGVGHVKRTRDPDDERQSGCV